MYEEKIKMLVDSKSDHKLDGATEEVIKRIEPFMNQGQIGFTA